MTDTDVPRSPPAFVPFRPELVRSARSVAELRERAARLLPEIATDAAARERDRVMPYEWVRRIAEQGLFTFRVPERFGGPGGTVRDLIRFIIDVAAVDSNVAQSLRPGFGFIESLLWANDADVFARWLPRVQAGEIFGNAGWERGGPNGQITARLTRDGDRYRVSGTKYYSTGALYADWVSSFALDDDGREVSFVVPRDRPGLQLVDDFDAMGQRLTASGTTVFDRVEVRPDELRSPMARIALGILNRVKKPDWRVSIASPAARVRSMNGVVLEARATLREASAADAVIFGSGMQTRDVVADAALMAQLQFDPSRQLLGAQCSGTLVLAKLGLLDDVPACTDLTTKPWVQEAGVNVLNQPFVAKGNVATAGGCLASQYLAAWVIARLEGIEAAKSAMHYVAPVGEKDDYVSRAMRNITPYLEGTLATA